MEIIYLDLKLDIISNVYIIQIIKIKIFFQFVLDIVAKFH